MDTLFTRLLPHGVWILVGLAFFLYGNTLLNDYAQDDSIVILQNQHTKKGFAGISKILTTDGFHGFFKKETNYISGGRYRPLSLVSFAIEWQFFKRNPFVSHLINVGLFGFLGILLFRVMKELKLLKGSKGSHLALLIAILFVAHPIHTEVVANIKGRDEILALGFCMASWLMAIRWSKSQKSKHIVLTALLFTFGLFSKENAITFFAVIPSSLILFNLIKIKKLPTLLFALLIPSGVFFWVWFQITGGFSSSSSIELMNNPFVKIENNRYVLMGLVERGELISSTMLYYLRLLFFPHPLTNDYYPRFFIQNPALVTTILSVLTHSILLGLAVFNLKKNRILSFGILLYFITISIASNILFNIGTNLSERFLFAPSLGFVMILAYFIWKWNLHNEKVAPIFLAALLLFYGSKTVSRNFDWKDNYALFSSDIKVSGNSAKAHNAIGGELIHQATKSGELSELTKNDMLREAISHLDRAIEIHPNYRSAYLLKGNAHCTLKEFENSLKYFEKAIKLKPEDNAARANYVICARQGGEFFGKEKNMLNKSIEMLKKAEKMNPDDAETLRLLGVAYAVTKNLDLAIPYLERSTFLQPNAINNHLNLGRAYLSVGRHDDAQKSLLRAEELQPGILKEKGMLQE